MLASLKCVICMRCLNCLLCWKVAVLFLGNVILRPYLYHKEHIAAGCFETIQNNGAKHRLQVTEQTSLCCMPLQPIIQTRTMHGRSLCREISCSTSLKFEEKKKENKRNNVLPVCYCICICLGHTIDSFQRKYYKHIINYMSALINECINEW